MINPGIEIIISPWLRREQWRMLDQNRSVFSPEAFRLEVMNLVLSAD